MGSYSHGKSDHEGTCGGAAWQKGNKGNKYRSGNSDGSLKGGLDTHSPAGKHHTVDVTGGSSTGKHSVVKT